MTGGKLRVNQIDGNFKNSGGTFSIGEKQSSIVGGFSLFSTGQELIQPHTSISGDFVQAFGGATVSNLMVTLHGPPSMEDQNGKLIVAGTITLDGQLTVKTPGEWAFEEGQQFHIIDAHQIYDNFSVLELPPLNSDLEWDVRGLTQTGILSVVRSERCPYYRLLPMFIQTR